MGNISSLTLVLIRPSNYDDDGYIIRYWRGVFPSNTLACLRSLTLAFSDRWEKELGISVSIEAFDELVEKVPFKKLARKNRGSNKVVAAIVGVQTNQFPRASDIAKKLTSLGIKTLIGGFHVSGVISMFDEPTPELRELLDMGVTLVQGEAEHVWESILLDVVMGREKPLYRMNGYPDISKSPVPKPYFHSMKKFAVPNMGTIDCSRGCPFNCSFCTIINVQGKKMRFRDADHVLKTIREGYKNGINSYFFTDDNFSRNPHWERIFDGLIRMREEENIRIQFVIQVDTASDRIPNFIDKAARAGCTTVFIGMESLNPKNLSAVGKTQNRVDRYASFIRAWQERGVITHVGYIIGFPYDTPESVRRDIEKLKHEMQVDMASFFILTPLPGSRDHYDMVRSGTKMDSDLNKYDSFHVVMDHPRMSREELFQAYNDAWKSFYDTENLKMVLARARRHNYWTNCAYNFMWYKNSLLEPRHPMVSGLIRRKDRLDVRPGTPVKGFGEFYAMRARELLSGFVKRIKLFFELQELWWLTWKPDEKTFAFITDFNFTVNELRNKIASMDINNSYTNWREEMSTVVSSFTERIGNFYNPEILKGKTKKRFNRLLDDMNSYFEKASISEYYNRGTAAFNDYLAQTSRLAEEFTLKCVKRRRSITNFWETTWERVKHGNLVSFLISTPKIVFSAVRDMRMSILFVYYFFFKNSWDSPRER